MGPTRKEVNRGGSWTTEEDRKLAQAIEVHGLVQRRQELPVEMVLLPEAEHQEREYLHHEEDLILRLHRLLSNSREASGPGRTDNEFKNYRNTHLSRKVKQTENVSQSHVSRQDSLEDDRTGKSVRPDKTESRSFGHEVKVDGVDDEGPLNLEWMSKFMEMDDSWFDFALPA